MNPRNSIKLLILLLLTAVMMTACKKDEPVEVPTDSAPVQQLSQDDSSVEYNVDEVIIDAGEILVGTNNMKSLDLPCNATLDSVYEINDTLHYHLTYDGLNCSQTKHRTGNVIIMIKQNTQWALPNAYLQVEFLDYKVTRVSNGKTVTMNGTSSLENISGGILQMLGTGINTVIHKNIADMMIAFNGDPVAREWHLTKMLIYTGTQGNLILAANGFGSAHGYNKLLSWGKDREGKVFFSQVAESIVFKEVCSFLPHSGRQVYSLPVDNLTATVTYGFNDLNEPVSGSECPTRYKLEWQQHGHSGIIFIPLAGNNKNVNP